MSLKVFALSCLCLTGLMNHSLEADLCKIGDESRCDEPLDGESTPECCWMHRLSFDAAYLYWGIKDSPAVPPLVVSGPVVPIGSPVLDQPDTKAILGGKTINYDWRSGGRFSLGYWFDDCRNKGIEVGYFFLPNRTNKRTVGSDGVLGTPMLSIPFYDVTTSDESSTGLANPGSFSGIATLKVTNNIQGAELNALMGCVDSCSAKVNLIGGFRYWNFDERLVFATDSPDINIPEDIFETIDRFHAKNNFYGGQIGGDLTYKMNCFVFNAKAKLALGAMCEEIVIRGKLITNDFHNSEDPEYYSGGYFGLPTNQGHHKHTQFAFIPEANLNLGYFVTERFELKIGYTYLYVSKVVRATKQMGRNINPSQAPAINNDPDSVLVGKKQPRAMLKATNFWAQGVNIGFQFHF